MERFYWRSVVSGKFGVDDSAMADLSELSLIEQRVLRGETAQLDLKLATDGGTSIDVKQFVNRLPGHDQPTKLMSNDEGSINQDTLIDEKQFINRLPITEQLS